MPEELPSRLVRRLSRKPSIVSIRAHQLAGKGCQAITNLMHYTCPSGTGPVASSATNLVSGPFAWYNVCRCTMVCSPGVRHMSESSTAPAR